MEEITVKHILQNIYELTQAQFIKTEGKETTVDTIQDLVFLEVDQLADLLGIELED